MAVTKERLEQLIDRSTDIVVATDRKGTVVSYNDGASKILGYKSDEVLGHYVGQLYPDLDEAKRVMAAVILNQAELLERDIERLADENDCSVETERLDAIRREVARIADVVERLGKMAAGDQYETVEYVGPARMVDLRGTRGRRRPRDPRLEGARVLVVDDDGGIRQTLAELLEAEGCKVETAGDGALALAKIEKGGFDVVLTDVVMPNMDGYELFTTVRKRWPELPILMMTAFHYDKDHIIKRSRIEGLDGVIFKKPVDSERLCAAIVEVMGVKR
ncbi:MAG: response regulator [Proteobacteria bacterium]|nr:response regulator [Pseudomonadota bacterium]